MLTHFLALSCKIGINSSILPRRNRQFDSKFGNTIRTSPAPWPPQLWAKPCTPRPAKNDRTLFREFLLGLATVDDARLATTKVHRKKACARGAVFREPVAVYPDSNVSQSDQRLRKEIFENCTSLQSYCLLKKENVKNQSRSRKT